MKADLLAWREFWFGWLIWSTKIVVFGLLWEVPELGYEIVSVRRKYEKSKFKAAVHERHAPDWLKTAAFLGWFLIVAGVAGEWVTSVKVSNADAALQDFSTAQLVDTRKEADAAKVLASLNEWNAARLNVKAAGLSKEAEVERHARVKLEAQIAPRRLILGQQVKISENCTRFKNFFKGKRIKVVSYTLDTEALVFGEQIVGALRASGMFVDDNPLTITPIDKFVFGINVFGSDSELAKKIADAIGSSGRPIAVSFVVNDPTAGQARFESSNSVADEVTVLVGLKPYDRNTANELKRIMKPRIKPVNP